MSALKQACERSASVRMPRRADHFLIERAANKLAADGSLTKRLKEPWSRLLARIDFAALGHVRGKDLRRLLHELWEDHDMSDRAVSLMDEGVSRTRKSVDRTIITSYLKAFPRRHVAFHHLTHAAALVANRHTWAWSERGTRWGLWQPDEGTRRVALALVTSEDPSNVLRDAGLDGDLATGNFVKEALVAACLSVARSKGDIAAEQGRRLISLFERFPETAQLNAPLALALLAPWTFSSCTDAHKKQVTALLVGRIGDPRLQPAKWAALRAELVEWFPGAAIDEAFSVLRRWLVQATFREFFAVVAKTVARRDQWNERTKFWMAYLDAGHIQDAWFAFGSTAERMARQLIEDQSVQYASLEGSGASADQSGLIFTLSDLRVGEWSDNGSCRLWRIADPAAPPLYRKKYAAFKLRAMSGGEGFRAIPHNPPNGWQPKFARHIYQETGIRHPQHGAGW